jgi:MFS family permease
MVVVLVFMLGLGLGSVVAAMHSSRLKNPFRTLGWVEISLCLVNALLIFIFGDGLREQGHALQAAALGVGISSSLVCALLSFIVLIIPCVLMGLTIPIAAEAAQRQLDMARGKAVSDFFFLNTIGAVLGCLGCGLLLLPMFGQKIALAVAAFGNLVAGLLILVRLSPLTAGSPEKPDHAARPFLFRRQLQTEEWLAFSLGALSLSYEIYLFRIVALAYTPLPWIFSVVLCLFLLFWSAGVVCSERIRTPTSKVFLFTALSVGIVPFVFAYQRFYAASFPIWNAGLVYFLPCFGFGLLFGQAIGRYAKRWGRDVGTFTALNTVGSALGIVITTFVLFEFEHDLVAWIVSLGLFAFAPYFWVLDGGRESLGRWAGCVTVVVMLGVLWHGLSRGSHVRNRAYVEFHGRDGVVEVDSDRRVLIDGLSHSLLYRDKERVTKNLENARRKMLVALLPFLAHAWDTTEDRIEYRYGHWRDGAHPGQVIQYRYCRRL